jgi:hypothetical protein
MNPAPVRFTCPDPVFTGYYGKPGRCISDRQHIEMGCASEKFRQNAGTSGLFTGNFLYGTEMMRYKTEKLRFRKEHFLCLTEKFWPDAENVLGIVGNFPSEMENMHNFQENGFKLMKTKRQKQPQTAMQLLKLITKVICRQPVWNRAPNAPHLKNRFHVFRFK